jgi:hypothetical protein
MTTGGDACLPLGFALHLLNPTVDGGKAPQPSVDGGRGFTAVGPTTCGEDGNGPMVNSWKGALTRLFNSIAALEYHIPRGLSRSSPIMETTWDLHARIS